MHNSKTLLIHEKGSGSVASADMFNEGIGMLGMRLVDEAEKLGIASGCFFRALLEVFLA